MYIFFPEEKKYGEWKEGKYLEKENIVLVKERKNRERKGEKYLENKINRFAEKKENEENKLFCCRQEKN